IFAMALSILLVLAGAVAYLGLPVAQYPEIAPPQIQIQATYPGADPEVLAETVATPIEEQVNGVENMLYMNSQMTNNGTVTITVTFSLGTNIDTAQVLVQNRVAIAQPRLPQEVQQLGVTTLKQSPDLMMVVTPSCCTSCGRRGWAIATRFCTNTCAVSIFVPKLNVTVIVTVPLLVICEFM